MSIAQAHPSTIILAGRTESKIAPVITEINKVDPSIKTHFVKLDLSDNNSVRSAAKEIKSLVSKIDFLINSAGIMALEKYEKSKDGYEMQLAACYIGHFLLTGLLLRLLEAGRGAHGKSRVVSLTSMGYEASPVRDDWNFEDGKTYGRWLAYGQAKTAVILFTLAMSRRTSSIEAIVVHPGLILSSGIMQNVDMSVLSDAAEKNKEKDESFEMEQEKTLQQGCATTLVACLDPGIKSGAFLRDCIDQTESLKTFAKDRGRANWLWQLTEDLVTEKFL